MSRLTKTFLIFKNNTHKIYFIAVRRNAESPTCSKYYEHVTINIPLIVRYLPPKQFAWRTVKFQTFQDQPPGKLPSAKVNTFSAAILFSTIEKSESRDICVSCCAAVACPRVRRTPKGVFVLNSLWNTAYTLVDLSLPIIAYPAVLSYRNT